MLLSGVWCCLLADFFLFFLGVEETGLSCLDSEIFVVSDEREGIGLNWKIQKIKKKKIKRKIILTINLKTNTSNDLKNLS